MTRGIKERDRREALRALRRAVVPYVHPSPGASDIPDRIEIAARELWTLVDGELAAEPCARTRPRGPILMSDCGNATYR